MVEKKEHVISGFDLLGYPKEEDLLEMVKGYDSVDEAVEKIKWSFTEDERRVFNKEPPAADPAPTLPAVLRAMLDEDDLEYLKDLCDRSLRNGHPHGVIYNSYKCGESFGKRGSSREASREKLCLLRLAICEPAPKTMYLRGSRWVRVTDLGREVFWSNICEIREESKSGD